ncbi:hypothetical protein Tco_0149074 [Tanacetum coccineum]
MLPHNTCIDIRKYLAHEGAAGTRNKVSSSSIRSNQQQYNKQQKLEKAQQHQKNQHDLDEQQNQMRQQHLKSLQLQTLAANSTIDKYVQSIKKNFSLFSSLPAINSGVVSSLATRKGVVHSPTENHCNAHYLKHCRLLMASQSSWHLENVTWWIDNHVNSLYMKHDKHGELKTIQFLVNCQLYTDLRSLYQEPFAPGLAIFHPNRNMENEYHPGFGNLATINGFELHTKAVCNGEPDSFLAVSHG